MGRTGTYGNDMEHQDSDVCVIGAGISGLSVAAFLLGELKPSWRVLVLERSERSGGAIDSFAGNGCLAEWGPHGFLDNCAESRDLIRLAGLEGERVTAPLGEFVRYVCLDGRLQVIPPTPLRILRQPLVPWQGKLRVPADLWRPVLAGEHRGRVGRPPLRPGAAALCRCGLHRHLCRRHRTAAHRRGHARGAGVGAAPWLGDPRGVPPPARRPGGKQGRGGPADQPLLLAAAEGVHLGPGIGAEARIPFGFGYLAPEREARSTSALFSHMFPLGAGGRRKPLEAVGGRCHRSGRNRRMTN